MTLQELRDLKYTLDNVIAVKVIDRFISDLTLELMTIPDSGLHIAPVYYLEIDKWDEPGETVEERHDHEIFSLTDEIAIVADFTVIGTCVLENYPEGDRKGYDDVEMVLNSLYLDILGSEFDLTNDDRVVNKFKEIIEYEY